MITRLNPKLIEDFREKVNDHNDFVRLYFTELKVGSNIEGKDIWSKICSCMDWLTVSTEGIELLNNDNNMNTNSLNFTHFLITIDMIVEAVNHLWYSIGQVNNIKQPYINDRSIFNGREFGRNYTDEKYFKEIRSWFGVHAVNGNIVQLNGFSKGVRFFSSWSSNLLDKEKFSINLYSNDKKAEEKYGGRKTVQIKKIIEFAILRYNTLSILMDEIDKIYLNEKRILQETPINHNPDDTDYNQLKNLYRQAKERRLTAEHYEHAIQDYLLFLSCDINEFNDMDKIRVTRYLMELKQIIPTYYNIIQEVDNNEYEVFDVFYTRSEILIDNLYDFSKVLEYANGGGNHHTARISLEMLLDRRLLPEYSTTLSLPCLYLLIHAIDFEHITVN